MLTRVHGQVTNLWPLHSAHSPSGRLSCFLSTLSTVPYAARNRAAAAIGSQSSAVARSLSIAIVSHRTKPKNLEGSSYPTPWLRRGRPQGLVLTMAWGTARLWCGQHRERDEPTAAQRVVETEAGAHARGHLVQRHTVISVVERRSDPHDAPAGGAACDPGALRPAPSPMTVARPRVRPRAVVNAHHCPHGPLLARSNR